MLPNRPVLIDIAALTAGWKAVTEWCTVSDSGSRVVNTELLRELFGGVEVTAHDCASAKVMGRLRTREMSLAEYLEWYATHSSERTADAQAAHGVGAQVGFGGNQSGGSAAAAAAEKRPKVENDPAALRAPLLYLKDWNFAREQPVCILTHRPTLQPLQAQSSGTVFCTDSVRPPTLLLLPCPPQLPTHPTTTTTTK